MEFSFSIYVKVILCQNTGDIVVIDEDIIKNSQNNDETRVLMGEKIGIKR